MSTYCIVLSSHFSLREICSLFVAFLKLFLMHTVTGTEYRSKWCEGLISVAEHVGAGLTAPTLPRKIKSLKKYL